MDASQHEFLARNRHNAIEVGSIGHNLTRLIAGPDGFDVLPGMMTPVPEADTYLMLLAGLALLAVVARRRR